jgi:hypothetical protein
MGSGASRNLDTQQIAALKQEVQGLKSEITKQKMWKWIVYLSCH